MTTALAVRTRAVGRATVLGARRGAPAPLPGATVRPFVPGTATPWPTPLYGADGAPARFPLAADAGGAVALWADAPGRLELECAAPGYAPRRLTLEVALEAPPAPAPLAPRPRLPAPTRVAAPLAPATRAAGYARSFGQTTVFGAQRVRGGGAAVSVPLAGVAIGAFVPGTDTPWPDPLYGDAGALTPLTLPAPTDASGQLALWADAPARVELRYQAAGYVAERTLLDLEPPPASVEGPAGEPGARGSLWYSASGAPTSGLVGAIDKDHYLDVVTGDVWVLEDQAGSPYGSGPYGSGPYGGVG